MQVPSTSGTSAPPFAAGASVAQAVHAPCTLDALEQRRAGVRHRVLSERVAVDLVNVGETLLTRILEQFVESVAAGAICAAELLEIVVDATIYVAGQSAPVVKRLTEGSHNRIVCSLIGLVEFRGRVSYCAGTERERDR